MTISTLLEPLFSQQSGSRIRADILECARRIRQMPPGNLIPTAAFLCVGMNPDQADLPDHFVMEKELFYFEKCLLAVRRFHEGLHPEAVELLMKAKWDFDHWALAHYLLGLIFFEMRDFKAAHDQFIVACMHEPYHGKPMEIMRELTYAILMGQLD